MSWALRSILLSTVAALMLAGCGKSADKAGETETEAEEEKETIASLTEDAVRKDGLFTFFRDTESGSVHMLIRPDQIDNEFIYLATYENGVIEAGHVRGLFVANRIISLRRHFDRIEFVGENTSFYYDPDSALSRAAEANISPAVLAVADIAAEDDEGILINVDDLFLSESLHQVKRSPDPDAKATESFALGSLSKDKSKLIDIRTYPLNVDVTVEYVYDNAAPVVRGQSDVTDSRAVSARLQHTFVKMPENDYVARRDDARVGYFTNKVTDLTSESVAPWRDVIRRWHLVKKTPGADLSEPVEPITWWIENTTPVEFRDTIEKAALAWNQAFETAGFRNAVAVKIQPDDAEWDAGDLRYNVLRWASSPQPPWGGYGPSMFNPRTGEIIGSNIMLEYVYVTNRIRQDQLFGGDMIGLGRASGLSAGGYACDIASRLQSNNMVARAVLRAGRANPVEESELIEQALDELVLHEIGHALGLNHNFAGSGMLTPDDLYSVSVTAERGVTGSVMDYAPVNLAPIGHEQGLYYAERPGPYDHWAIQYGYSEPVSDPLAEPGRLEAILARSTEPALAFGNDGDSMGSPGVGIDPRIMLDDMSDDPVRYADERLALLRETTAKLTESFASDGSSYQALYNAYLMLGAELIRQANVASRQIGGVHIDRAVQGQPGGTVPFTAVDSATQRRAMDFLARSVFSPVAFDEPGDLYRHLQVQRRGFDFMGLTEDPKIHARALAIQKSILDHLLNSVVMTRITDSGLYGNKYSLADMMQDLSRSIFAADMAGEVNAFRQALQLEYVNRLVAITATANAGGHDYPSRSLALYNLQQIRGWMSARAAGNTATRAHTAAVGFAIDKALETS
jgi:hypothetical protein